MKFRMLLDVVGLTLMGTIQQLCCIILLLSLYASIKAVFRPFATCFQEFRTKMSHEGWR